MKTNHMKIPTIRTISLWQWWASAMAHGFKKNETRHWNTSYRGPLAIHAAKHPFRWDDIPPGVEREFADHGITAANFTQANMPMGAIVGVCNLVDVFDTDDCYTTDIERLCGNYAPGRFAWKTTGMERLLHPVIEKGRQGFWTWQPPDDFELTFSLGKPPLEPGDQTATAGKWVRK